MSETAKRARALLDKKISEESSFFSKLRGRRQGTSSANDFFSGLVEGAFLVAAADGEMSEEEETTLGETLHQVTGDLQEPEEFVAMINAFEEALYEDGFDKRLAALAGSLPDEAARREVISFAALVALCDRHLADAEWKSLLAMGNAFSFSKEAVETIVNATREELGG